MRLTHKASAELRESLMQLLEIRPGISRSEIQQEYPIVGYAQVNSAIFTLRHEDLIRNCGTQRHPRYFLTGCESTQTTIPAVTAQPLKSAAMPEQPLSPTEYCLHVLSLEAA